MDDQFAALFRGRVDAYGTDQGGCDKVADAPLGLASEYRRRVTLHLWGQTPMGTYPLMDDGTVWWGCTDLDYVDDPTDALNLATLLRTAGVNGWVEVSRSKGFHVWTFAVEPVPAATMRNALLAVHQMLDIRATEVNPKQTSLDGLKGFGNYVRLPYPGALMYNGCTENGRQMVYNPDHGDKLLVAVDTFVEWAHDARSPLAAYEKLANLYVPPPPPKTVTIDDVASDAEIVAKKLSKDGYLAFRYGPKDGYDRSDSLARLGHLCLQSNLTASEAFVVLRDADRRWGKFFDRPDCDDQLMKLVTNAYG